MRWFDLFIRQSYYITDPTFYKVTSSNKTWEHIHECAGLERIWFLIYLTECDKPNWCMQKSRQSRCQLPIVPVLWEAWYMVRHGQYIIPRIMSISRKVYDRELCFPAVNTASGQSGLKSTLGARETNTRYLQNHPTPPDHPWSRV